MATGLFQPLILFHAHDITGDLTDAALNYSAEALDDTTLEDSTRSNKGGLKVVSFESSGFFQADVSPDLIDPLLFANLGSVKPLSIGPTGSGAEGQTGYTFAVMENVYNPIEGAAGVMLKFSLSCAGAGDLVRGTIMLNGTITATGNGTSRQLGAVVAGQKVYASLHVTAASGSTPTLDVTIDSSALENMGSPTTRITFTQVTASVTSEGPLSSATVTSDDWWRVEYTITGGSPSYDAFVLIGIQ